MVDKRIKKIFSFVFGTDNISLDTSMNDVVKWDSFGHIEFMVAIEKEFYIQFTFSEIAELTNVKKIQENLESKGALR